MHHLSLQASHLAIGSFYQPSTWIYTCAPAIYIICIYICIFRGIYINKLIKHTHIYIYTHTHRKSCVCVRIWICNCHNCPNLPSILPSTMAPRPHLLGACSLRWPPAQQLTSGKAQRVSPMESQNTMENLWKSSINPN
jgi:hypothetical protein